MKDKVIIYGKADPDVWMKHKNSVQRLRNGFDWTWLIILVIFLLVIIAGVLENKEILNLLK